jgi:hypothetical protein
MAAFIYSDAMTESKGDTPHLQKKDSRHSHQGATIRTRVIAVEVVCVKRCKHNVVIV